MYSAGLSMIHNQRSSPHDFFLRLPSLTSSLTSQSPGPSSIAKRETNSLSPFSLHGIVPASYGPTSWSSSRRTGIARAPPKAIKHYATATCFTATHVKATKVIRSQHRKLSSLHHRCQSIEYVGMTTDGRSSNYDNEGRIGFLFHRSSSQPPELIIAQLYRPVK